MFISQIQNGSTLALVLREGIGAAVIMARGSFANLEHHHFKYDVFRQACDGHLHMFGTATLSFADRFTTQIGDIFEIYAPQLGLPLRNPLGRDTDRGMTTVTLL